MLVAYKKSTADWNIQGKKFKTIKINYCFSSFFFLFKSRCITCHCFFWNNPISSLFASWIIFISICRGSDRMLLLTWWNSVVHTSGEWCTLLTQLRKALVLHLLLSPVKFGTLSLSHMHVHMNCVLAHIYLLSVCGMYMHVCPVRSCRDFQHGSISKNSPFFSEQISQACEILLFHVLCFKHGYCNCNFH